MSQTIRPAESPPTTSRQSFRDYIQDNPRGYWFKRRWYGWGWVPAKREGWIVLGVWLGLLTLLSVTLTRRPEPTQTDWMFFFGGEVVLVGGLIAICYWKGEKPKWQWGPPKR